MSPVWFYTLVLSFVSGIFCRSFLDISWPVILWLMVMGLGMMLIGRRQQTPLAAFVIFGGLTLIGLGLGMLRLGAAVAPASTSPLAAEVGQKVELVGQVVREPEARPQATNLTIAVGSEKILVQTDRHTPVRYGDTVTLRGKLALPKPFVTDLGREFDYPGYLAAAGITYTMAFGSVEITDNTTGNPVVKKLFAAKQQFMHAVELVIPEPAVGLGEGLILGAKQALGDDIETAFRRSGIIHIVVLSGYNIMIIVQFVMMLLAVFLPLRARIVAGMVSIVLFALLVGAGASVVRASIMAVLGLLALGLGRQYAVMRALFIAGAGMLIINPLLLVHDVGFQLSFMATLGLILISPELSGVLSGRAIFGVKEFLIATLATQLAVLPILLYQIGQFSLIAVVVNVLVLPVVSFAMLGTFLAGCVALISPPLAGPFAAGASVLLSYIIVVATRFSNLPFAAFDVPAFPFFLVPIMYAGMGYVMYRRLRSDVEATPIPLPPLDNWVIEDEAVLQERVLAAVTKNGRGQSPRPSKPEPPIFFR